MPIGRLLLSSEKFLRSTGVVQLFPRQTQKFSRSKQQTPTRQTQKFSRSKQQTLHVWFPPDHWGQYRNTGGNYDSWTAEDHL
jgi:hypothetical protein